MSLIGAISGGWQHSIFGRWDDDVVFKNCAKGEDGPKVMYVRTSGIWPHCNLQYWMPLVAFANANMNAVLEVSLWIHTVLFYSPLSIWNLQLSSFRKQISSMTHSAQSSTRNSWKNMWSDPRNSWKNMWSDPSWWLLYFAGTWCGPTSVWDSSRDIIPSFKWPIVPRGTLVHACCSTRVDSRSSLAHDLTSSSKVMDQHLGWKHLSENES